MARKPFVKKQRPIPPNSRFNWDMLDVYRYKNEVLKEAREKVRSGEMTPEQARTWLQDEVEAATGHRPEVMKGRMAAGEVAKMKVEIGKALAEEQELIRLEEERGAAFLAQERADEDARKKEVEDQENLKVANRDKEITGISKPKGRENAPR